MENREKSAPSARAESSTPSKTAAPTTWAEDWSQPPHRMNATVPLIWMAILLAGCVAWGYFAA